MFFYNVIVSLKHALFPHYLCRTVCIVHIFSRCAVFLSRSFFYHKTVLINPIKLKLQFKQ